MTMSKYRFKGWVAEPEQNQNTRQGSENVHNCVNTITIPLPHRTKFRLTGDIPNLECHCTLTDFAVIEGNGWNDILCPLSFNIELVEFDDSTRTTDATCPEPMTFTNDVFPDACIHSNAFNCRHVSVHAEKCTCNPTTEISADLAKKMLWTALFAKSRTIKVSRSPAKPKED